MGRLEVIMSVEDLLVLIMVDVLLDFEDKIGDYVEDDYDGGVFIFFFKFYIYLFNVDGFVFDRLLVDFNGIERLEGLVFEYIGLF